MTGTSLPAWWRMHRVGRALATVRRLSGDVIDLKDEPANVVEAVQVVADIDDTIKVMRDMRDVMDETAISMTPWKEKGRGRQEVPVPGGGVYKVSGGTERKSYDGEGIITAMVNALSVTEDGEILDRELVERCIRQTVAATGATAPSFTGWRTTVLGELGIDANVFADRVPTPLHGRVEGRGG